MYYVPDGTKECGYYECKKMTANRFSVYADDEEDSMPGL